MSQKKNPLLSLIIPQYKHRESLPRLLESAMRQSLKSLEVIVVDDASREASGMEVEAYRNRGLDVRLIRQQADRGAKNARLTGIENARGQIIAFADADGTLYGERALERHADMMLEADADIVQFNVLLHYKAQSYPDCNSFPLAERLEDERIFARWAGEFCHGGTMWNKLYSSRLCRKNIDACFASRVRWGCEDYFLTAWFLFHARLYLGSQAVGYAHHGDWHATKMRMAAGRMVDLMFVMAEFIPYLIRKGCPVRTLEDFHGNTLRLMNSNFEACCQMNGHPGELPLSPMSEEEFRRRWGYVDPALFSRALQYLLLQRMREADRNAGAEKELPRE